MGVWIVGLGVRGSRWGWGCGEVGDRMLSQFFSVPPKPAQAGDGIIFAFLEGTVIWVAAFWGMTFFGESNLLKM